MRISRLASSLALVALAAACTTEVGSSNMMETGVGFGNYQEYLRSRAAVSQPPSTARVPYSVAPETPRTSSVILPPSSMPAQPATSLAAVPRRYVETPPPVQVASAPIAAPIVTQPLAAPSSAPIQLAAAAPPGAPMAAPMTPRPVQGATPASTGTVRTVQAGTSFGTTPSFDPGPSVRPQVSDEQDFRAVSARETIESDRERLARNREQYQVIQVASVPGAEVSGGPNLVAYALSQQHAPGTTVYRRMNPLRWSRWENACLQFRNQDAAQEAFLASGGPERDPGYLDPDGDGFACWWDPTPLRNALARN